MKFPAILAFSGLSMNQNCGLDHVLLTGRFCLPLLLFFFRIFLILIVQIFFHRISLSGVEPYKFKKIHLQVNLGRTDFKNYTKPSFAQTGYTFSFVLVFYIL